MYGDGQCVVLLWFVVVLRSEVEAASILELRSAYQIWQEL